MTDYTATQLKIFLVEAPTFGQCGGGGRTVCPCLDLA